MRTRTVSHVRPRSTPRKLAMIACLALAGALLPLSVALGPDRAHAAELGQVVTFGGYPIGTLLTSNGEYAYCVEPGALAPFGAQQEPREVSTLPGYSGFTYDQTGWYGEMSAGPATSAQIRQINYLLWQHGRTSNANTAAAVQLGIWLLRDDPGTAEWMTHHLNWIRDHGGAATITRAKELAAEARDKALPPQAPVAGALEIVTGSEFGYGSVSFPAHTTELSITGGSFIDHPEDSPLTTTGPVSTSSQPWAAEFHSSGWQRFAEVEVSGGWKDSSSGWPASLMLIPAVEAGEQRLAVGVKPVEAPWDGEFTQVRTQFDTQFTPELTTQIAEPTISLPDTRVQDTVTLGTALGSAPWASRFNEVTGELVHAPVIATGTLYGPFTDAPERHTEAPSDAPVAGTAELIADLGPGEYLVDTDVVAIENGYYTWVWEILGERQLPEIRDAELIPIDYVFRDDFGIPEETVHVNLPVAPKPEKSPVQELAVPQVSPILAKTGDATTSLKNEAQLSAVLLVSLGAAMLLGVPTRNKHHRTRGRHRAS